ncbi:LLM class oxidoreductase [Pontibacillus litoralis]|uniref:Coenzyme F420-dependent N5,N10-methylene tetrahydromethanopterin reductase n=1 Tax=Pontibacillus litoralis JSM 072002 TaxID=1385512 RepID=A0A0A5G0P7_9BACI|nr:LLM class oxidoreductase [Pontibacillus litoralis]KGX86686.1 coenzyme F420-dependent N5,N10-methylene tetrahydromethanopterin reductase [Pontibacillus litoralis JSM 072002]
MENFQNHNGYRLAFQKNKLTLGFLLPLESYTGSFPKMDIEEQLNLIKQVDQMGFASLFVRDAPIYDPKFGDVGFLYDPFLFLTYVAAHTEHIALGTSSIVTTLRNPLHLAKTAASLDRLSKQRFIFGVATGDRAIEFPTFKVDPAKKGDLFQESITVMRKAWQQSFPQIQTEYINLTEGDIVPKPLLGNIPTFGTGYSRQTIDWLAENTDGWLFYPQNIKDQKTLIKKWSERTNTFKPFVQPVAIDLSEKANEFPKPITGGFRAGYKFLIEYLNAYQEAGVNHVAFVLKPGKRPANEVVQELGEEVLPYFPSLHSQHHT